MSKDLILMSLLVLFVWAPVMVHMLMEMNKEEKDLYIQHVRDMVRRKELHDKEMSDTQARIDRMDLIIYGKKLDRNAKK